MQPFWLFCLSNKSLQFLDFKIQKKKTPNTIRNIKLLIYLKLPSIQPPFDFFDEFYMKKSLQHLHLTLHRHIDEYEKKTNKTVYNSQISDSYFFVNYQPILPQLC